jgi:hypothetical protein
VLKRPFLTPPPQSSHHHHHHHHAGHLPVMLTSFLALLHLQFYNILSFLNPTPNHIIVALSQYLPFTERKLHVVTTTPCIHTDIAFTSELHGGGRACHKTRSTLGSRSVIPLAVTRSKTLLAPTSSCEMMFRRSFVVLTSPWSLPSSPTSHLGGQGSPWTTLQCTG